MAMAQELKLDLAFQNNRSNLKAYLQSQLGAKFLGDGRDREVYEIPGRDIVIKIPVASFNRTVNRREYEAYQRSRRDGDRRYAVCRLVTWFDIEVLIMEKVDCLFGPAEPAPLTWDGDTMYYPRWIYSIDSEQVGYDKRGNLVAYDYSADELNERKVPELAWNDM